jgi:hypothetical protein
VVARHAGEEWTPVRDDQKFFGRTTEKSGNDGESQGRQDRHALEDAERDLQRGRDDAINDGTPALTLTMRIELNPSLLVVRVGTARGAKEVRLSPQEIIWGAGAQITPLALVAYVLVAPEGSNHLRRARRVGGTTRPKGEALNQLMRGYRYTAADREIERALRDGLDVVLRGDYGAGKTATATATAQRCADDGYGVVWLDLTDPADGAESLLAALLTMVEHRRYLVFVDSVQANPPAFEAVQRCVQWLREELGLAVQILATAWPRLVDGWREPFQDFRKVTARTEELIEGMLDDAEVPPAARISIKKLVDVDVNLARDAVDFYQLHGRVATWSDLQSALTEGLDDDNCRKALYWFASIGFFGLDASSTAVVGRLDPEALERLVNRGLIAHSDGRYAIPSHAKARLALRQAVEQWNAIRLWGRPEHLAWEHMQRGGERVIKATLGRLDLVGISGKTSEPSTRYLAKAWELFAQLARALARRCDNDPTWGDNVGAAIFAAQALVEMDYDQVWQRVADYIRGRWKCDIAGVLPEPVEKPSAESDDFEKIRMAMEQEDIDSPRAPYVLADPAGSIDMGRFYRMWMLGQLLGFEGTAMHPDPGRLNALRVTAEREIDPSGFFEPRRVPWVTARVIIGLCQAGGTYGTSDAVRHACDWLRRPVSDGGPFDNGWQSGTGSWNTPELTTAMCVIALLRAHAPAEAEVSTALMWLRAREDEWTRPGREIDLALVLEAMLLGDDRQKVYRRGLDLLAWAKDEINRAGPDGMAPEEHSQIPEAGLRTPFVVAQLGAFVWATVIREYKALMKDLIQSLENESRDPASDRGVSDSSSVPVQGSSPEGIAGVADPTLVEPRPGVAAWHEAVKQLNKKIVSHLDSRNNLVRTTGGTKVVHEEIAKYRQLRQRTLDLAELIGERTPAGVLVELDRYGREQCGAAWPDLEVPGEPGEPGEGERA